MRRVSLHSSIDFEINIVASSLKSEIRQLGANIRGYHQLSRGSVNLVDIEGALIPNENYYHEQPDAIY